MRQGAGGGTRLAAVAALCAAVLCGALPAPGQPAAVAADGTADPPSVYRTAEGAERTEGTASSTGAPELKARRHYTDAIGAGETLFYRVRLDEESNAHLSAVAALPPAGGTAYGDGIEVTLRSADGARCDGLRGTAGPGGFGLPVAATASRLVRPNASCQEAGEYLFTVERIGDAASGPGDWPLEISFLAEPGVTGGATEAPGGAGWSTEPPAASGDAGGLPRKVRGGTGFNDAAATGTGVWRDRLEPGETLFYRIPVDWGQRLRVTADVGGAELTGGAPHLGSGVLLRLHNTARTPVHEQGAVFDGQPKRLGFSTAPAAFGHRFGGTAKAGEMRFAGWYHLSVALTPEAAGHMEGGVDLTLRLAVEGEPQPGPAYDGDAAAAGFAVSDEDRERAAEGRATAPEHAVGETDGKTDGDGALRTVGFAGIGAGTVLLLGLAVWTLAARRRTAGSADTATTTAGPAVTAASGGMPHLPAPGRRPEHPLPGGPGPESTPPERHGGGYGQPPRH